jgi:hypothetical protein
MTTLQTALPLPAELRLQVYKHLILASLASGSPRDLSGAFLSCRTAHTELDAEIANVRPLLTAARRWLDVDSEGKPLQIELSPESGFVGGSMEGEISIPTFSRSQLGGERIISLTWQRRDVLMPVFGLSWSTLKLSVRTPENVRGFQALFYAGGVFRGLFLKRKDVDDGPLYQDIERLTLDFKTGSELEYRQYERRIVAIAVDNIRLYFETTKDYNKFWIKEFKMEPNGIRWEVGLDFVEGLKEIGEVQEKNEYWQNGV